MFLSCVTVIVFNYNGVVNIHSLNSGSVNRILYKIKSSITMTVQLNFRYCTIDDLVQKNEQWEESRQIRNFTSHAYILSSVRCCKISSCTAVARYRLS